MIGKDNQSDESGSDSKDTGSSGDAVKETTTEKIVEVEEEIRSADGRRKK